MARAGVSRGMRTRPNGAQASRAARGRSSGARPSWRSERPARRLGRQRGVPPADGRVLAPHPPAPPPVERLAPLGVREWWSTRRS